MRLARKLALAAAILLFVMTVGSAVMAVWFYTWPSSLGTAAAPTQAGTPSGPAIRVGFFVGGFTSRTSRWAQGRYFQQELREIRSLQDPIITLIPLVAPNEDRSGPLSNILRDYFPRQKPLDASDSAQLRQLQVLVFLSPIGDSPQTLQAVDDAVSSGVGLLRGTAGTIQPDTQAEVTRITGISNPRYGVNRNDVDCQVVADSPLLGDLSGHPGRIIRMTPQGFYGQLAGTPLIKVQNMSDIHDATGNQIPPGTEMYPLYTSQLGQGRIVGLGFAPYRELPQDLDDANHSRFYIHCVQWLAGVPVQ